MGTFVLSEVPDSDVAAAVTADELSLIRMDHDVVYGAAMRVVSLYSTSTGLPDLNGTILRTSDHPFTLTVKSDTSHIPSMTFEGERWRLACAADIVELDIVVTCSGEIAFVG